MKKERETIIGHMKMDVNTILVLEFYQNFFFVLKLLKNVSKLLKKKSLQFDKVYGPK